MWLLLPEALVIEHSTQQCNFSFIPAINIIEFPKLCHDFEIIDPSPNPISDSGLITDEYKNIIYGRVWIIPNQIDVGIIASDRSFPVTIWNAYLDKNLIISSIEKVNLSTEYIMPNIVNKTFAIDEELRASVMVPAYGHMTIKGYFNFKFNQEEYKLFLAGYRGVVFPFLNYLQDKFQMQYSFDVITAKTFNQREQRRLVMDKCKRRLSGAIVVDKINESSIINLREQSDGRVVIIPIPIERMKQVQANLKGLSVFTVQEDISKYVDLFLSSHIVIVDEKNKNYDVKKIVSINSSIKQITVDLPFVNDFYKDDTFICPCLMGEVEEFKTSKILDKFITIDIDVQERVYAT